MSMHHHITQTASKAATMGNETKEAGNWFWKIFGGAVVSVMAIMLLTMGQYLNLSINDLRSDVFKMNREMGENLKQSEYKQDIKELEKEIQQLKERIVVLESKK